MLRTRLFDALATGLLGAVTLACPGAAAAADPPGALYDMPVPGGLRKAMRAVGDPAAEDRSQFLLDFIRRSYNTPRGPERGEAPASLLAYLDRVMSSPDRPDAIDGATGADTLPLPLPPAVWHASIFGGRPTPRGLLGAILESRDAALLYYGLLSLDDNTRAWLADQPDLVADIAARHAAIFVVAAPGLRVAGGAVRVPGGAAAEASWEALVGAHVTEPAAFVRALLARESGLAYFFGALGPLTAAQAGFALTLDAGNPADRQAAAERLLAVFRNLARGWDVRQRTFWRPPLDPALLLAGLRVDAGGRPELPGSQRFWTLVFADSAPRDVSVDRSALVLGPPPDFAWLCDQVFRAEAVRQRRYRAVLSASRLVTRISEKNAVDTVVAVRAAAEYPALAASLERAGVTDPGVVARAARRAAQLSAIGNEGRAVRAITQFQGTLAVLLRAGSRLTVTPQTLAGLVSSLSSVDPGADGDYEGALVRWIDTHLRSDMANRLDADLLRLVAGPAPADQPLVEWEGTRYRVDLTHAETSRITRLLGERQRPHLHSAVLLESMAHAWDEAAPAVEHVRRQAAELAGVAHDVGWEESDAWPGDVRDRYRDARAALERVGVAGHQGTARGLARALHVLADDLLARGLIELTYAAALGQPDRAWIAAGEVADRHVFALRPQSGRGAAWELPANRSGMRSGISVTGSLLGLDVALADLSLVRVSLKPPPRQPMLASVSRGASVGATALVRPAALTDRDRDDIAAAMRSARERVAAIRTPDDGLMLAQALGLSAARTSLLQWMFGREPARVPAFLSPGELLRLGLGGVAEDSPLHAWGAPAVSRLGCLCLQLPRRETSEIVAGRWGSGMAMSAFPDLNLRLAELLSEMRMPASLLGPVLAAATLDFVNTTVSRDEDDRRGLVEYVNGLNREQLEQYLALLTTDGPLVPIGDVDGTSVADVRP